MRICTCVICTCVLLSAYFWCKDIDANFRMHVNARPNICLHVYEGLLSGVTGGVHEGRMPYNAAAACSGLPCTCWSLSK